MWLRSERVCYYDPNRFKSENSVLKSKQEKVTRHLVSAEGTSYVEVGMQMQLHDTKKTCIHSHYLPSLLFSDVHHQTVFQCSNHQKFTLCTSKVTSSGKSAPTWFVPTPHTPNFG